MNKFFLYKLIGIIFLEIIVCSLSAFSQEKIKIGTHNSLSYLKPQWWLRWMNFTAKCQNFTIEEQYEIGVRYFDVRLKFTRKGVRAGHGPMTYEVDFDRIFSYLDEKGDCLVNIVLENRSSYDSDKDAEFVNYVTWLIEKYPSIRFVGGEKKYPWENLISLGNVLVKTCFEIYTGDRLKLPYPWKYAKRKNKRYWQEVNEEAYSLFDFVELYCPFDSVRGKN